MSLNAEISKTLYEIGEILTIKGDRFKSRAYNTAAQRVAALPENISAVAARGELEKIPSVGKSIALTISEYLESGMSSVLLDLRDSLPPGVLRMIEIEGIGPKLAMRFSKDLDITGIEELEAAAKRQQLRGLKGLGPKKEENIIKAISEYKNRSTRFLLGEVLPIIQGILTYMGDNNAVRRVEVAGSARRRKETVGDLDVLVSSNEPEKVTEHFVSMPPIVRILGQGPTKSTVVLKNMLQVDLRVILPESYGAALQYFTGSKEHNVNLRTIGVKTGLKLNEYGLYDRETDELIAAEDEETIYESMGMRWMPPELRENTGEIEASIEGRLPDLVSLDQIRGDLHLHTDYSHAADPLEHLVEKAVSMGHEYIAITDHSKGLAIAKGLSEKKLVKLLKEIEALDEEYPEVRILTGTECDIKGDGSMDYSNEILSQLDFVIASIHTGFQNNEEKLTQRMIDAIHNPYVKAIGHPTGRLIQRRSGYALNLERVFETAAEQDVFMEINGSPSRLDLTDVNARRAKEMGVKLSLGSDAHNVPQMEFLPLGVSVARRGWLTQEDVVNTWELEKVLDYRK
ncbi:DNA polymerase/3'-5' exonuclease PolX [Candidatus Bathyarchaeota archaeon]|nr:DNA polymerase/3'-5' exonuclease PolX [Candidatus Bathyarchaeota archaeon]MBT4319175.1 DNA polymerase/3'-5' exonuclease PolX [Candidatus Bathyarchaeota archaeon]MBT4422817.1 DNA polymerase/3'-5' exonuclease PolX [Candidatus Bathyarchaeota archaeon]MBT6605193.1 DNA polymerase/3'-5' exonuclease PolX [Candidatus Bathyarchaeota archaeon]MBT7186960.1 DNA polymerase/3'-5' exonuclease PolX [Candidatus Bathyarchaeota archaeon]